MAMPTATPTAPRAQVVGNAFVEQYYLILHQSPELVFKFYQDSSVLSRPEPNGVMTSVTTMQAINDKILSLDCMDYKVEITTADAQDSYKDGVTVLVTGWLIRKDDLRRKFTQSFFLAPQDKGYFVLNDIFRYVDDNESLENIPLPNGSIERELTASVTPDPEPIQVPDYQVPEPATSIIEEDLANGVGDSEPSDNVEDSVVEVEVVAEPLVHSSQIDVHPVAELASSTVQEDAPKKTYASIVKVMKGNIAPRSAPVPTKTFKVAPPVSSEQQSVGRTATSSASESLAPSGNGASESTSVQGEVEGYSIYIRGLPLNATVQQVDEAFKKFGAIKPGGVQVRSNRQQGVCFGFVEFELQSSIHSAIEASPVPIGDRQAVVEEKKTTSRGGGRGRFPPGRGGGLRNDNFRGGRGNFGGGRGYGRNDFGGRSEFSGRGSGEFSGRGSGEFSGRGRGPSGRSSGEGGYQRFNQNGDGRAARPSGTNQTAVSS